MDYQDENGEWIGFDADMAKAFAKSLGVEAEFVEIDWDNKIMELGAKDHRLRLERHDPSPDEVTSAMACSNAYCNNSQVVVVPADKAADYQSVDACSSLNFAVESGPPARLRSKSWATASPRSKIRPPLLWKLQQAPRTRQSSTL